jgi:hypothetical protein
MTQQPLQAGRVPALAYRVKQGLVPANKTFNQFETRRSLS